MASDLGARLRAETHALHVATERSPFVQAMLRAQLPRPAYCLMLRNLHPIYIALESALLAHATHPMVAPVFDPALHRAHALARDLVILHGSDWATSLPRVAASEHYAERLDQLQNEKPHALTAHAYVRYLGDLSGGQLLKRIVRDGLHLDSDAGTDFYDFGDSAQTTLRMRAFRDGLVRIPGSEMDMDEIISEARFAYERHLDLFDQLAAASMLVAINAP